MCLLAEEKCPCLAVFSLQAAEPSPEIPQCFCDPLSLSPQFLCHPPAEGRELRRAGASSCRIQEDAASLFKEVRGVGAGAGGSVSPEETEVACFG